jgi:uncharacterized protein (UPF0264 family)
LLISVRSAAEAALALEAGAAIIDVKEPDAGPLGRAPTSVWQEVSETVRGAAPISVALGELSEWLTSPRLQIPPNAWAGIAYRKLGLAGATPNWRSSWRALRESLAETHSPAWIAVAYADWKRAGAPDPDAVLATACESEQIVGVLLDTWDKAQRLVLDLPLVSWAARVRCHGKLLAIAGGLDVDLIAELDRFMPDIVALRGAACVDGNRRALIDPQRVSKLARLAARIPEYGHDRHGVAPERGSASNLTPWASGSSLP